MIKKPITIHLSTGLEARPVAQLVQVASQFNSEIYVEIGRKKVNAKSTPCVAAIASIKRELGGKWAIFVVLAQCVIAWLVSFAVYLVGGLFF